MATAPPLQPTRHALGLPAGSIRAVLALGILGYLWLLVIGKDPQGNGLLTQPDAGLAFVYMQLLMVLILTHYFSAHGSTIAANVSQSSALGLPRGTIRLMLLVGYLTLSVWAFQQRAAFKLPENAPILLMLIVLTTAYFLGYAFTGTMKWWSRGILPPWFQDVQAWVALMGMVVLGIALIVRFVINTSLPFESQIGLEVMEAILAGIVGFYFGARS